MKRPIIMALHGSASNAKQWRSLTEHLSPRFCVVSPDLPGYGSAVDLASQSETLESTARYIAFLIDLLKEPVHLIGHYFGGAVALKIASMWPDKIRSLTLIEPAAFSAYWTQFGREAFQTRAFCSVSHTARTLFEQGDTRGATASFINFWNGAGTWDQTPLHMQDSLTRTMPQVLRDFAALFADRISDCDLASTVCPVRILRGNASPHVMTVMTQFLMANLPFASESVIVGAGHMLPLSHPQTVNSMIGTFLDNVDRTWRSCDTSMDRAA